MSDTQVSLCHCSRLNGIGFQSAPDRGMSVGWFEAGVLSIVMNGSKMLDLNNVLGNSRGNLSYTNYFHLHLLRNIIHV